jgi:hypothetical protein
MNELEQAIKEEENITIIFYDNMKDGKRYDGDHTKRDNPV